MGKRTSQLAAPDRLVTGTPLDQLIGANFDWRVVGGGALAAWFPSRQQPRAPRCLEAMPLLWAIAQPNDLARTPRVRIEPIVTP
jgi:hypothetical protein